MKGNKSIIIGLILLFALVYFANPQQGNVSTQKTVDTGNKAWVKSTLGESDLAVQWPKSTNLVKETLANNESIFNATLLDSKYGYSGYVQVYRIDDIQKVFDQIKMGRELDYKKFSVLPVETKAMEGYVVQWMAQVGDDSYMTGNEYFLHNGEKGTPWVRLSFFVKEKSVSKAILEIEKNIVTSIK